MVYLCVKELAIMRIPQSRSKLLSNLEKLVNTESINLHGICFSSPNLQTSPCLSFPSVTVLQIS